MHNSSGNSSEKSARYRHLLAFVFLPVLFIFFGMSSWMSVNTIWVEMPLLASSLPENWGLPAYVSVLIQLGNIGPLAMIAVRDKNHYAIFIYMIIVCLMMTNFTMAFVFHKILPVAGQYHSVAFFILAFILSLCDCTSSVTFLPYMAHFNPRYLVYFFIGQGMGGLVPSALGLIQGSGSYSCVSPNGTNSSTVPSNETVAYPVFAPPRFGFSVFMFAAVGILAAALCAFVFIEITLQRLKIAAVKESKRTTMNGNNIHVGDIINLPQLDSLARVNSIKTKPATLSPSGGEQQTIASHESGDELLNDSKVGRSVVSPDSTNSASQGSASPNCSNRSPSSRKVNSPNEFILDYFVNGFLCFMMNGLLPSVQSYSALPYGQLVYSLIACLWVAAVPLASWLTMFARAENINVLSGIGATGIIPAGYCLALAFLCPTVPLQHDIGGFVLAIVAWFMTGAIFFYTRVCVAQRVQRGGHRALFWFGLSTQGASLLGAIVAFLLVPVFHVLHDPQMC